MRRIGLVLVLAILVNGSAYCRVSASVRLVPNVNPASIPSLCGPGVNLKACTAFRSETLRTTCAQKGTSWRINGEASYELVVYLTESSWVAHEMLHVRDVKTYVDDYLARLQSRGFESKELCEGMAHIQSMVFPQLMNTFKEDSNEMRHAGYVRKIRNPVR